MKEKEDLVQQERNRLIFILCLLKTLTERCSNMPITLFEEDLKDAKCKKHKEIELPRNKQFYLNKISSNLKILSPIHYYKYKSLINSLKKNIADVL